VERAIESIFERIRETELFAAVVSSGVAVSDYKRLEQNSPNVVFSIGGNPIIQSRYDSFNTEQNARWIFEFCSTAILNWQAMGLDPKLRIINPEGLRAWLQRLHATGDASSPPPKC
jgi:6-phosphofructokinase